MDGHGPVCVCELCCAERTARPAPLDDRIQLTRAEFLAAIDRAFNDGVEAERARLAGHTDQSRWLAGSGCAVSIV